MIKPSHITLKTPAELYIQSVTLQVLLQRMHQGQLHYQDLKGMISRVISISTEMKQSVHT